MKFLNSSDDLIVIGVGEIINALSKISDQVAFAELVDRILEHRYKLMQELIDNVKGAKSER